MDQTYRAQLLERIDNVFASRPHLYNHRSKFPWLTGALGDPAAGIWFIAENPSLSQIERVTDPRGGPATEEAQWWASRGDRLFRDMLVKHGFKDGLADLHGGWRCYITNVIKEADYAENWRGSSLERQQAAALNWAPVLSWELEHSRPCLVVALGKTVTRALELIGAAGLRFPKIVTIQHYSYVALRPRGRQGPMHPARLEEYDREFASVRAAFAALSRDQKRVVGSEWSWAFLSSG